MKKTFTFFLFIALCGLSGCDTGDNFGGDEFTEPRGRYGGDPALEEPGSEMESEQRLDEPLREEEEEEEEKKQLREGSEIEDNAF